MQFLRLPWTRLATDALETCGRNERGRSFQQSVNKASCSFSRRFGKAQALTHQANFPAGGEPHQPVKSQGFLAFQGGSDAWGIAEVSAKNGQSSDLRRVHRCRFSIERCQTSQRSKNPSSGDWVHHPNVRRAKRAILHLLAVFVRWVNHNTKPAPFFTQCLAWALGHDASGASFFMMFDFSGKEYPQIGSPTGKVMEDDAHQPGSAEGASNLQQLADEDASLFALIRVLLSFATLPHVILILSSLFCCNSLR